MANENNLKHFTCEQSREEAVKNGRTGGKKSVEVRRKRKAMKEQMELLLSLPAKDKEEQAFMSDLGIKGNNWDNQMLLIIAMYKKAKMGDVSAFQEIRKVVQDEKTVEEDNKVVIVNDLPEDGEIWQE